MKFSRRCAFMLIAFGMLAPAMSADIYHAKAAYEKKDFAAAFTVFRSLAELGHPLAQESVAIMYASGQGVARDGMLAYGWAQVARENGAGSRAQVIVDQLQPFVTPDARKIIDEIHAKYGKQALQQSLLPTARKPGDPPSDPLCKMRNPANPDDYYPRAAIRASIPGSVTLVTPVHSDGRARNPQILYSVPPDTFSQAGRQIAFATEYTPAEKNGAFVPCSIAFAAHFTISDLDTRAIRDPLVQLEKAAAEGDPLAQLEYAMLMSSRQNLNPDRMDFSSMFLQAAQAGLPMAQYIVGASALHGSRFLKDRSKGVRWLEMAADAGQPQAQIALANELMRDTPGGDAFMRAHELLGKAVASGNQDGRFYLAALLVGDPDSARRDPRRALALLDEVSRDEDPTTDEMRAAAQSQLGDFAAAARNQKRAIEQARKLKWDLKPQVERLESYEKQQAWAGLLLVY
jgi:TPR repeat protein